MSKLMSKIVLKGMGMKQQVSKLLKDERGDTNIIAIILILAIVIALAIIFRTSLESLFQKIWNSLFDKVDGVIT